MRGYLPIALPAENSNLDEVYVRGKCDIGGLFSKITNRARLGGHENYEI